LRITIKDDIEEFRMIKRAVEAFKFKSPTAFIVYAVRVAYQQLLEEELRKAGMASTRGREIQRMMDERTDETMANS
jgi:hypothetical protein